MFKYILYKIGLFLLHHLPPSLAYRLATFVSDLQYYCSFRDRRAVRNNLKKILPNTDRLAPLTKEVFRNFGKYLIEFFQMKEMVDKRFIENNVHINGIERLDQVLAQGKGGIVITAHLGNWELGGVLLSVLGYPLMAIALPHKERPVNDLFNFQREIKGITIVPSHNAIRLCTEQLKDNKLIALVADRVFGNRGIIMDFLGSKMMVPKGAAMFAVRTGAPILPTFLIRNEDNTFTMMCEEPIYPPNREVREDEEEEIVIGIMRQYLTVIEQKIRDHPSQWLMFREFSVS